MPLGILGTGPIGDLGPVFLAGGPAFFGGFFALPPDLRP